MLYTAEGTVVNDTNTTKTVSLFMLEEVLAPLQNGEWRKQRLSGSPIGYQPFSPLFAPTLFSLSLLSAGVKICFHISCYRTTNAHYLVWQHSSRQHVNYWFDLVENIRSLFVIRLQK